MTICIYQIRNKRTNKIYYGSAECFETRYGKICDWKQHHNWDLKKDAKRGDNFCYEMIAECKTLNQALQGEQAILDFFKHNNLWHTIYNVAETAYVGGNLGKQVNKRIGESVKKTLAKPEIKKKLSEVSKKNWKRPEYRKLMTERATGKNNPMYGANRSGENNGNNKLTKEDVIQIKSSNKKNNELAIAYGIKPLAIYRIKKNIRWKHI